MTSTRMLIVFRRPESDFLDKSRGLVMQIGFSFILSPPLSFFRSISRKNLRIRNHDLQFLFSFSLSTNFFAVGLMLLSRRWHNKLANKKSSLEPSNRKHHIRRAMMKRSLVSSIALPKKRGPSERRGKPRASRKEN